MVSDFRQILNIERLSVIDRISLHQFCRYLINVLSLHFLWCFLLAVALVPRDLSSASSGAASPQLPVLTSANLSYAVVVGDTCRLECQVSLYRVLYLGQLSDHIGCFTCWLECQVILLVVQGVYTWRLECQVSLVVIQGVTSAGCYNLQDKNQLKSWRLRKLFEQS